MKINNQEIVICAPSYRRPRKVRTLEFLPSAEIYIANEEYAEYAKNNPAENLVAVDNTVQGNLCRVRNHILKVNKGKIVVLVDDDLKEVGYHEGKKKFIIQDEDQFYNFIAKYSILALDLNVRLWGINVNPDTQCYHEWTPFSMTSYIGGPFMVHMFTDLEFDERLPLKEDYDFTLQNLNKYRKVLRVNKYFYDVKQNEQVGGCAVIRNRDQEDQQMALLIKKWGSGIVKREKLTHSRSHSSTKKRAFDINPIITAPVRGV